VPSQLAREAAAGKTSEAIDNLRKALALTKNVDTVLARDAVIALGDAYAAHGEMQNAVTQYGRFLDMAPAGARVSEVLWKLASTAARAQDFRKSNDACNRLLKSAVSDEYTQQALLQLAHNARKQATPNLAIQYYSRFAESFPEHRATPAVLYESAVITENDLADSRKASAIYEILADRHPQSTYADDALIGTARCQEQLREFDRALQLYGEFSGSFRFGFA
jgi:outer membrane protein assembly factor BamD (BamD/ComL family)